MQQSEVLAAVALGLWAMGVAQSAPGALLNPFSLVVYRVGDGSAPLSSNAAPVFLDEYTLSGALIQSIPLPATGPQALTATGNDSTEGIVSRSSDGRSFIFTGYRKNSGTTNPAADSSSVTNRVVGSIRLSGALDTLTALIDAPDGVAIRNGTTVNGSVYWVSTAGGVRYVGAPGGPTTSVEVDSRDSRQVNIASSSVLYASNGSAATATKVQHYGGLPSGSSMATPIVSLTTADAVNAFVLFNTSASIAGVDMLFVLSTTEGLLRKYGFDGTSWIFRGSVATSAVNLAGRSGGGAGDGVELFLTSATQIEYLTTNLFPEFEMTGTVTMLTTAGANTAFRGIAMTVPVFPIPEAYTSSFIICSLAIIGGHLRRCGAARQRMP